jgi:ABC-type multidrug transport system fused ATPase/permease subunit
MELNIVPATLGSSIIFFKALLGRRMIAQAALICVGSLGLVALEGVLAYLLSRLLAGLGVLSQDATQVFLADVLDLRNIKTILCSIALVSIVRFICQFVVSFFSSNCQQYTLLRLRQRVFVKIFNAEPEAQMSPSHAQFLLSSVAPKASSIVFQMVSIASLLIQVAGFILIMIKASPLLTFNALLLMAIAGLFILRVGMKLRVLVAKVPPRESAIYTKTHSTLRNWIFLKIMRLEHDEYAKLSQLVLAHYKALYDCAVFKNINQGFTSLVGTLTVLGLVYLGNQMWNVPGEVLVSFLYLNFRLVGVVSNVVNTMDTMALDYSFMGIVLKEMSVPSLHEALPRIGTSAISCAKIDEKESRAPEIKVENLGYRYPGSSQDTLQNVTFDVASGEQVGIVGPSGAGKSTLLSLILGIYRPHTGEVWIQGKSARALLIDRGVRVGYVGPDPFIVGGSIRENLIYGNSDLDISDNDIWLALQQSALRPLIESLIGGLEYTITEVGEGLSVGQKQRLALARALLRKPKLLVLDECTANLDDSTEQELAETLLGLKGQVTIIIVSHKPGILKHADLVINVPQGTSMPPVS